MTDNELHTFLVSILLLLALWLILPLQGLRPGWWAKASPHDKFRVGAILAAGVLLFACVMSVTVAVTYNYAQRTAIEECNAKGTFILKRGPERGRWILCEEGARLPPEVNYE